jgi:hypothetical protein
MNETEHLAVEINGKWYTREEVKAMPREPELRNLTRWIQENQRPNTSQTWMGIYRL